jgi:AmiR/NasT family two-component response regulator
MMVETSFVGRRATVLHRPDDGIKRLSRQLALLGIETDLRWAPIDVDFKADLILFDADQGWDGLFSWEGRMAPVPLVALLGSEAPGRVAWAIAHGAGAIIPKPIVASAVYPALVLACALHEERLAAQQRISTLEERLRLRPVVQGAVRAVMAQRGIDEERAYRSVRRAAMRQRITLEQMAAAILTGKAVLPEAS